MNASRWTEWWALQTASIALLGLAVGLPPALAAAIAAAGLTVLAWRPTGPPGYGRRVRVFATGPEHAVFSLLPGESCGGASSSGSGDDGRGEDRSYTEFAAALEEEEEEDISFLPPYASGEESADSHDDAASAVPGDPRRSLGADTSLLRDLPSTIEGSSKLPTPRRFALGTVAILRNLLQPGEVERILIEQRRYPALRFGDAALQLGLLSEEQRAELVQAQQDGMFSEEEIREARRRVEAWQRESA